jgi:hypothetical protein
MEILNIMNNTEQKLDEVAIARIRYQLLTKSLSFNDKETVILINESVKEFIHKNNIQLIKFCSDKLKNDRSLVLELVKVNGKNLSGVRHSFKDDQEIVLAAVKSTPDAFQYISKRFRENNDIVNFVLRSSPEQIKYVSKNFKSNKELVCELLKLEPSIIQDIHPGLKDDLDVITTCWESIKQKHQNQTMALYSKTCILLDNIGDGMSPFFEKFRFNMRSHLASSLLLAQMESCVSNLMLTRELSVYSQTKSKRVKI